MPEVFKMLLEGAQKTRAKKTANEKLKSILNSQESKNYEDRESLKDSDDPFADFEDFSVGEEKDKNDYLSDIDKLSMKELDKKPAKEQLKILKLEYNRTYDKLNTLNQSISNSERLISDLQMARRTDEEEVRQMRNLVRRIVHLFPGQTQLKATVDQGTWQVKEIFEEVENAVVTLLTRVKETDSIIEEEVGKIKAENLTLKDKILQYREYFNKIEELEKMILEQSSNPTHTAPPPVQEPPQEETSFDNLTKTQEVPSHPFLKEEPEETPKESKFEKEDDTVEHNPHFSDFFSEFKSSFDKMKESEKLSNEKDKVNNSDEKNASDTQMDKKVIEQKPSLHQEPDIKESSPVKHPLSPDYVELEKEEIDDLFDVTIDAYLQNISIQQEYLLTVIGKTGISRNSDIKDYLKNDSLGQQYYFVGKKFNSNALNRDIADLRDKGILADEQISYGGKGGGTFNVYELSTTGKSCFKKIANDNPVIPEKRRIKGHHGSLEHGYLIKDSAKLFREMGFKVYTDLEDVSIKIDPKHRKVFDFIAEDAEGKLIHIEVERGTHTQEDFSYAMDKIYEITKEFYFICPNEQVKNKKTKKQFFTWVTTALGGIQNADVVLNMTTIEQLRKKPRNLWEVTDLRSVK